MSKSKNPQAPAAQQAWTNVSDMPLEELQRRAAEAAEKMQEILGLFPGLVTLTADERQHSRGRIRTGEGKIFLTLVSVMEKFPELFLGLADLDEGVDPTRVETELLRDRILRAEALAPLSALAERMRDLSDTVLHFRGLVRDPIGEAYGISKAMARTNTALRSMLAPVLDFYAAAAKLAAASRKANAEAESAKKKG